MNICSWLSQLLVVKPLSFEVWPSARFGSVLSENAEGNLRIENRECGLSLWTPWFLISGFSVAVSVIGGATASIRGAFV
jgi:hypothetical protein